MLHVHILALKVGLCLFHSTTSVLSQCTIFLPSLCLPYIFLLLLFSGARYALFPNIYPKFMDYQGEVDWSTVVCP